MVSLRARVRIVALLLSAASFASVSAADPARSDTLITGSIRAGQVLIRTLPERLSGRAVDAYAAVRMPVSGWLHDRSFFWRVPGTLSGTYRFAFAASLRGGARDTVHVSIDVTSRRP